MICARAIFLDFLRASFLFFSLFFSSLLFLMYLCHVRFWPLQIRTRQSDSWRPVPPKHTHTYKHFLNAARWLERGFLHHQQSSSQRKSQAVPQLHHEEYIECAPFTPVTCAFKHIGHIPAEMGKTSRQSMAFLVVLRFLFSFFFFFRVIVLSNSLTLIRSRGHAGWTLGDKRT